MTKFIESFEDEIPSPNALDSPPYLFVAITSPYSFAPDVQLINPIGGTAVVGDFDRGSADFGGFIAAPDVPSGSAYLALDAASGRLELKFAKEIYTVGAYVNTKSGDNPTMVAWDKEGKEITGIQVNDVAFNKWHENYVELVSRKPIASVTFTGGFVTVDDLVYDTKKAKVVKGTKSNDNLTPECTNKSEFVEGKGGNDKVNAKDGNDTIDLGAGEDKANGGDGDDSIVVREGDTIRGDADQDTFYFLFALLHLGLKEGPVAAAVPKLPKIKDFTPVDDTIMLSSDVFEGLSDGILPANQFRNGSAAADADDRIIYDSASGKVLWDSDGTGPTAAIAFVQLSTGLALTSEDFVIT
jgi:Ca2+-binding RTX toxin-like protein